MVTSKSSQTFADLFAGNRHGGRRGCAGGWRRAVGRRAPCGEGPGAAGGGSLASAAHRMALLPASALRWRPVRWWVGGRKPGLLPPAQRAEMATSLLVRAACVRRLPAPIETSQRAIEGERASAPACVPVVVPLEPPAARLTRVLRASASCWALPARNLPICPSLPCLGSAGAVRHRQLRRAAVLGRVGARGLHSVVRGRGGGNGQLQPHRPAMVHHARRLCVDLGRGGGIRRAHEHHGSAHLVLGREALVQLLPQGRLQVRAFATGRAGGASAAGSLLQRASMEMTNIHLITDLN